MKMVMGNKEATGYVEVPHFYTARLFCGFKKSGVVASGQNHRSEVRNGVVCYKACQYSFDPNGELLVIFVQR